MASTEAAAPRPALRVVDAVALVVGIVVGAGIFRTPSLVASNLGSEGAVILAWFAGGVISLLGAMCYAELASAYPHPGGDYHYLTRAFGRNVAFLFGWARLTVIPTGSIALIAFVFGDYASQLLRLGEHSSAVYAALVIAVLTGVNVAGIQQGKWTQNVLTAVEVLGVILVIVVGLLVAEPAATAALPVGADASPAGVATRASWGLSMVFVLLTYGGWNDAAYVSAEMRGDRRGIARALLWGIGVVTALYVLVNLAYLRGLGLGGVAGTETVAAELLERVGGERGAQLISLLIAVSALTSVNATTLMGARASYALGRDFPLFAALGRWRERASTPANALLVQGAISLALVLLGALTREGFQTMVEYTAPVFWFFFLLAGVSLFVLRRREPDVPRPFRVPLYPLTPALFCLTSAYLLYSSLAYTGVGALVGVAVLGVGAVLLLAMRAMRSVP
jgi:APA family basic amino acid/polyamine antiporter